MITMTTTSIVVWRRYVDALSSSREKCVFRCDVTAATIRDMHGYDYIERSVTLMCFLCVAGGVWVAVGGPSPVRRGPRYCPADPPARPRFLFLSSKIVSECAVCVTPYPSSLPPPPPSFVCKPRRNLFVSVSVFCGSFSPKCRSRVLFPSKRRTFFLFLFFF